MHDKLHKNKKEEIDIKHTDFFPLPKTTTKLLETGGEGINFSLFSNRMVKWDIIEKSKNGKLISKEFEVKKERTEKGHNGKEFKIKSAKQELCAQSKKSFVAAKAFLEKKHKMQEEYLEQLKEFGIEIFSFDVQTASPFISGLGSGHPTETGMILDRNIGVPYLPASSIKGVVRTAYAVNIADDKGNADDSCIEKYFGTVDVDEVKKDKTKNVKRGQLVFLDAYPKNITELRMDIMNPHFGKYYNKEHPYPTETDKLNPIQFLVVPEKINFTFRCFYLPFEKIDEKQMQKVENGVQEINEKRKREIENIENDVQEMFETAFKKIGFGGKTAIGYGRFKKINAQQKEIQQMQAEREQQKNSLPKQGDIVTGTILSKNEKKGKIIWRIYINGNTEILGTVDPLRGQKLPDDCAEGKEYEFKVVSVNSTNCMVEYQGK